MTSNGIVMNVKSVSNPSAADMNLYLNSNINDLSEQESLNDNTEIELYVDQLMNLKDIQ